MARFFTDFLVLHKYVKVTAQKGGENNGNHRHQAQRLSVLQQRERRCSQRITHHIVLLLKTLMRPRTNAEGVHPARMLVMSSVEARRRRRRPGHSHASCAPCWASAPSRTSVSSRDGAGPPFLKTNRPVRITRWCRFTGAYRVSPESGGLRAEAVRKKIGPSRFSARSPPNTCHGAQVVEHHQAACPPFKQC